MVPPYQVLWVIPVAFITFVALMVLPCLKNENHEPGNITEVAAVMTLVLGVLLMHGALETVSALSIVTLVLLAHKRPNKSFRPRLKFRDREAALTLPAITSSKVKPV